MLWKKYIHAERRLSFFLKDRSITFLRFSLSVIFIWYGALKIAQMSPAEELVLQATSWAEIPKFIFFLGCFEVLIGLLLAIKKCLRFGLLLLFLHFPGTFLPVFLSTEHVFTSIPFGLTLEGQYIFKNILIFASALVLISSLHSKEGSKKSYE